MEILSRAKVKQASGHASFIYYCTNLILNLNVTTHSLKSRGSPEFPALSSLFNPSPKKVIFYDFALQVLTQELHISRAVKQQQNCFKVSADHFSPHYSENLCTIKSIQSFQLHNIFDMADSTTEGTRYPHVPMPT